MKEELEDFIRKNRASFDDESPSEDLWNKIENEVFDDSKSTVVIWSYFWKVAAVVFFVLSGYLLWQLNSTQPTQQLLSDETDSEILEDFTSTENYYMSEIAQMTSMIDTFQEADTSLTNSFKDDIEALDEQYEALKVELDDDKNEQVINALILNLQLRMEILNKQIVILNNLKNSESNENVSI